jgi:hypothetical protein
VRTDPGLMVVTNGALEKVQKARGTPAREVHRFARTRVISTYLAALTIGRLEATKPRRIAGTPCRILCGTGKLGQTGFAEDVTRWVLPWYQEYFGQKYNYQKLDQVAVPGFDAGAMENVGAIFYRQNLLLMAPGATSWQAQKRIAEVVAHEIAHQWFGSLVTGYGMAEAIWLRLCVISASTYVPWGLCATYLCGHRRLASWGTYAARSRRRFGRRTGCGQTVDRQRRELRLTGVCCRPRASFRRRLRLRAKSWWQFGADLGQSAGNP